MSKEKQTKEEKLISEGKLHPVSKLKIRRADEQEVRLVNKPRKMNLVKPRRIPNKTSDYSNSSLLVFPTDVKGLTRETKAAIIKAASKIGKDEANLKLFKDTLAILVKHVEARFEQNMDTPVLKQKVRTYTEAEQLALEAAVQDSTEQEESDEGNDTQEDETGSDEDTLDEDDASEAKTETPSEETTEEETTDESTEEKEDESDEAATEEPVKEEKPKAKAKPKKKASKKKATKKAGK